MKTVRQGNSTGDATINKKALKEGIDMEERQIATEEETREQIMEVIQFYLPTLTDRELRMVRGTIKGIVNSKKE